ncbi:glycerophosphodiester phosphodiesterase [Bacillus niameyensis]|uniref:glycerophosphodiester phosphodiesterase n=1 Tax=Bacillus niameyensis TaxID=1522308 RepID=UPI000783E158|nr:glycerophosphodiester phosphodiesterase family protein [Bacillus niameyensis]
MTIRAQAHRGYPVKYPENTLAAYQAAYDLGYEYLELDVQLSKDGVPILMHDITVNRMTDAKGFINDFTFEQLRQLKVGGTERIPTLEEALQFANGKMKVAVELKQHGNMYPGLEEKSLEVIEETGMKDQVYVNSFDHYSIVRMRELSKDIELGIIQSGASPAVFPFMKEIEAKYLSVKVEFLTDYYVRACEEAGIQLVAWPVDKQWQFDIVKHYPSVLSTTNQLEEFKKMIEQEVTKVL